MTTTQLNQSQTAPIMPTQPTTPTTDPEPSEGRKKYFIHLRTDVLAMIPDSARTFLSVGCGSGRTEAELIKRGLTVTGIELDPVAAALARDNGLDMLEGDVNHVNTQLADRSFDCLLYADVLEHIVDPITILREHVARLNPGGCAIISVPNFRHHTVLRQLFLQGHIRYTDAGIFDRTHVRITTRRLIQEWFSDVGLTTDAIDYRLWRKREETINTLTLGLCREFLAYQVILRGVKSGGTR